MKRFDSIEDGLKAFAAGQMVICVDDEDRENEGDLICAAEKITPQIVNFMAKRARGLICLAIRQERLEELKIPAMVGENTSKMGTPFAVSVDAIHGTTTGISAYDRAHTIKTMLDPATRAEDLARPGHVFPLGAADEGVLRRAGHTEAAVDLARLASLYPAGVLCEIMDSDGTMARLPKLLQFKRRYGLRLITVKGLIEYRLKKERLIRKVVTTKLPTRFGDFQLIVYESIPDEYHHLALVRGDVKGKENVLVRVHSQCLTGDVFGSSRCDCGDQLIKALKVIEKEGEGVFLYMRQEGRGIGLLNKLKAYELQDQGLDTVEANEALGFPSDLRDYGIGAQILVDLGLKNIRLLTNNPRKIVGLEGYGLRVVERIPLEVESNPLNYRYLKTKKEKLGHDLRIN